MKNIKYQESMVLDNLSKELRLIPQLEALRVMFSKDNLIEFEINVKNLQGIVEMWLSKINE